MHLFSMPIVAAGKKFVDWEEQFVSHDRGSRVVHYYLKDRHGSASLAVVGTERSLRHMVYVVCDDFLPLAGLDKSATPSFKWRSRREVVDWLSTFLVKPRSDQHLSNDWQASPTVNIRGFCLCSHFGSCLIIHLGVVVPVFWYGAECSKMEEVGRPWCSDLNLVGCCGSPAPSLNWAR